MNFKYRKRTFSPLEIKDIIASYKRGETLTTIARNYGYADGTVAIKKVLVEANIPKRENIRRAPIKNGKKRCYICNKWLVISSFYKRKWKGKPSTPYANCKKCGNSFNEQRYFSYIKKTYNFSKEDYFSLLKKQNYSCAICKYKPPSNSTILGRKVRLRLVLDHCHKTNKVRGLLCDLCNKAIGQFKESIENIRMAVEYLENAG